MNCSFSYYGIKIAIRKVGNSNFLEKFLQVLLHKVTKNLHFSAAEESGGNRGAFYRFGGKISGAGVE